MVKRFTVFLENLLFNNRKVFLLVFGLLTLLMLNYAVQLRIDAGYEKTLPLKHPYMQVLQKYRSEFGAANKVVIALEVKQGQIFTRQFFETLEAVTDEISALPGVDRTQVFSLFTPTARYNEIVEDGLSGGQIIPADFQTTTEGLNQVKQNIIKSNYVGLLVANDFSAAMVIAGLVESNPATGERLDYFNFAKLLEEKIRTKYANPQINVRIIGFAKVIGDVAEGAMEVLLFFLIAFLITAFMVYRYSRSMGYTIFSLMCSLIAVIWQLGLLTLLGFGIDPMSILIPFLVFAIGVSHGVQMINASAREIFKGCDSLAAARSSFRRLFLPGGIALLSDTIGFLTLLHVEISIIRELAIAASLGVAVIILTNLFLLPVLLSFIKVDENLTLRLKTNPALKDRTWRAIAMIAKPKYSLIVLSVTAGLFAFGIWKGNQLKIGDLHQGVPELHQHSRYNQDTAAILERFSIGVDVIDVMVTTEDQACIDYPVMNLIDRFHWYMENIPGVQSVSSLPGFAKKVNLAFNEGYLKWRILPRHPDALAMAVEQVPRSSGVYNIDCTVMPVKIYTEDHRAETLQGIIAAVNQFNSENIHDNVQFLLASGNVGVMAAANEAVESAQMPMLLYVYGAVMLLCLITFQSLRAMICIIAPLALVSVLSQALMTHLEIGLKVFTLPVVALGVGIGVDYGIYIFSTLQSKLEDGLPLVEAYFESLHQTGNAVLFTGITLAIGVSTWILSALKFQADMGILLTFMFLLNMLAAILLIPAFACWLIKPQAKLPAKEHTQQTT